ncbi:MAG: hypothetical protein EOP43_03280 [Sphingobacteriaceae bacterium]|nr:MAG: hypothetical protein EOP43_03280 [Sphingobacteriaceae bacterium]
MEKPYLSGNLKLDESSLRKIFSYNLNQTYSILLHIEDQLPKLAKVVYYGDLHNVVEELLSDVKIQINRLDEIFFHLKEVPTEKNNPNFSEKFQFITPEYEYEPVDNLLRDLSYVLYLQKIIGIKTNCFFILKSIAHPLNNINVKQCLLYNFDNCKDNQLMIRLVAKEYMESNINNFLM